MERKAFKVAIAGVDSGANDTIAEQVRLFGSEVTGIYKGAAEVTESLSASRPDIVIADVILDGSDGFDVVQSVKAFSPDIVCIVVSDSRSERLSDLAYRCGTDYYAVKPADACAIVGLAYKLAEQVNCPALPSIGARMPCDPPKAGAQPIKPAATLEERVAELLNNCRLTYSMQGYFYVKDAIMLVVNDRSALRKLNKEVYEPVAVTNKTNVPRVERSIRLALESAWERGYMGAALGVTMNKRPTNGEFIALLADKVSMEFKSAAAV